MEAFDVFDSLRKNNLPRKKIVDIISKKFSIPVGTLYDWYRNKHIPYGRKGIIKIVPELFYVIGALLGDGCLYKWKPTNNYVILVGDRNFTSKYANFATICTGRKTKAYIIRSKNIWFVKSNNFELYSIFRKSREDLQYIKKLLEQSNIESSLLFIEGFFDAEGCVKIVKEPTRKIPKICLDITNTNFDILEIVKSLMKKYLDIEASYSVQEPHWKGKNKKTAYHLRIYKKAYVKKFLENISTTKLREEKISYVNNWLNNGK